MTSEQNNAVPDSKKPEGRLADMQRLILDTADEAFCLFSAGDERVITYNQRFADFFDLSSDWLETQPTVTDVARVMYQIERSPEPDEPSYVNKVLDRHHRPGRHEIELRLHDGRVLVGRSQDAPSGERLYTFTDVTNERRFLWQLQAERERLMSMVEHAPVAYYIIDCKSGTVTEISRSVHYLTGLSSPSFLDRPHESDEQIHPEDQQFVADVIGKAVINRESYDIQYRRYHRDESIRWFRDMAEPIPDPDLDEALGRPQQMAGVIIDITRQKAAERKLRESERRFRELIEGISDLIFYEHDTDRQLTYLSPSVQHVLGYQPRDLLGSRFGEQKKDKTRWALEPALEAVQTAIRTRSRQPQYEVTMVHKNGRTVTLEVMEYPVISGTDVVGFRGVGRDVTTLRGIQRALRERERLAILGTFAGGIAHDLNNLLLPIHAGLDTLERDPTPERVRSRVAAIRRATEHIAELTTKLLIWTRNETADDTGQITRDVPNWIKEALTFFRESIRSDDDRHPSLVRVQLVVDDPPSEARIDPDLLKQALLNLILNARDAMATGGSIELRVEQSPPDWLHDPAGVQHDDRLLDFPDSEDADDDTVDRAGVRFTVTDDGCGMDESTRERAFDPFFSTKPRGKSTGLGLALVRSIVQSVSGVMRINSELGEGTSITLDFPVPDEDTDLKTFEDERSRIIEGDALVSLRDPWIAAFVNNCVQKAGLAVRVDISDRPQPRDVIWVTEPDVTTPEEARQVVDGHPGLTLLCIGARDSHEPWPDGILWLEGSLDAAAVQRALRRADVTG
ncbi:MAG: PAS domain S-box protein [Planctomycetes bacterium]|nr:PAS domain S-box protein [Planctomycetota bacterium]NOG56049.1 PAS domain S-box protein [Planctomycetota bacterium]